MYLQNILMRWDSNFTMFLTENAKAERSGALSSSKGKTAESSQDPALLDAIPILWSTKLTLFLKQKHHVCLQTVERLFSSYATSKN